MRIRFKSSVAGPLCTYRPGEEIEHQDEAQCVRWIKAGVAEPVKVRAAETGVARAPEDTTLHLPRGKRYVPRAKRPAG